MAFLELAAIRKSYYLGKEEFPVLKGIDLRFERGELPGRWGRILVGRPRISPEPLKLVGVRVPASAVEAFDAKAARLGQTRSQRLRALIERDLEEDAPIS